MLIIQSSFKKTGIGVVILVVSMNDIVIIGSDKEGIQTLIHHLDSNFLTKDLVKLRCFLSIEVAISEESISYLKGNTHSIF